MKVVKEILIDTSSSMGETLPGNKIKMDLAKEILKSKGYDIKIVNTLHGSDISILGFDSLMLAELTVEIESEYEVDIFDDGLITQISEIKKKLNE